MLWVVISAILIAVTFTGGWLTLVTEEVPLPNLVLWFIILGVEAGFLVYCIWVTLRSPSPKSESKPTKLKEPGTCSRCGGALPAGATVMQSVTGSLNHLWINDCDEYLYNKRRSRPRR